jgi:hypothetical protein
MTSQRSSFRGKRRPLNLRLDSPDVGLGKTTPRTPELLDGRDLLHSPPSTLRTPSWEPPGSSPTTHPSLSLQQHQQSGSNNGLGATTVIGWAAESDDDRLRARRSSITTRLSKTLSSKATGSSKASRSKRSFFGAKSKQDQDAASPPLGEEENFARERDWASLDGVEDAGASSNSARALGAQLRASKMREAMMKRNLDVALATIMHLQGCVAQANQRMEMLIEDKLSLQELGAQIVGKDYAASLPPLQSNFEALEPKVAPQQEIQQQSEQALQSAILAELRSEVRAMREESAVERRLRAESDERARLLLDQRAQLQSLLRKQKRERTEEGGEVESIEGGVIVAEESPRRRQARLASSKEPPCYPTAADDPQITLDAALELELLLEQRDEELSTVKRALSQKEELLASNSIKLAQMDQEMSGARKSLVKAELELETLGHLFSDLRQRYRKLKLDRKEERKALRREVSKNAALDMLVAELRSAWRMPDKGSAGHHRGRMPLAATMADEWDGCTSSGSEDAGGPSACSAAPPAAKELAESDSLGSNCLPAVGGTVI